MTYELVIGDYAYSSWSLRGWLLFVKFGIAHRLHQVTFADDRTVAEQMPTFAPARTVPTVKTPDGAILSDSLAIAEELADRHPDAGLWPSDPLHRATARALCAEMHSGFSALRTQCPMGLRTAYDWAEPSAEVLADVARIEELWAYARSVCGSSPWLCGDYSIVDAFYAPVAARIAGFSLPVSEASQTYVDAHLNDLAFRRWRAMGLVRGETLPWYAQTHPTRPWPGPAPVPAKPTNRTDAENDVCPYSGKAITDLLELGNGKVYGFCNPFCRDKTVADPMAWPAFAAIAFPDTG